MISAYLQERFRLPVFGPLALVLAAAASGGRLDLWILTLDGCVALLLLAQFRLWDDLADWKKDAVLHPGRVLASPGAVGPVTRCCVAVAAGNLAVVAGRGPAASLALLVLLTMALAVWYRRRAGRTLGGDQLLLAKYPAFVLILAGSRLADDALSVGGAAVAIYLAASAWEAWHDPVSPLAARLGGRS